VIGDAVVLAGKPSAHFALMKRSFVQNANPKIDIGGIGEKISLALVIE
jgi:hypothetical protein